MTFDCGTRLPITKRDGNNAGGSGLVAVAKAPTGVSGLDEITLGGLPVGRPSLICGRAGAGKTLFAATFLVAGAVDFGEPGVFMSFEEPAADLVANVASLGYDLAGLIETGMIVVDHIAFDSGDSEEVGLYNLDGLFVRLAAAVDRIGARRVVLDRPEMVFTNLSDTATLRSELHRLFGWIKARGLTAVITADLGTSQPTPQGIEEYVADCVILLDNRVVDQISTRRLRIAKYRGSAHGTNEYPFLIDHDGISVLPVTAAGLTHGVSNEIVPSGIDDLDAMLGKGGFFRGSSVLVTGMAGAGKTTLGATFTDAACRRGERCLFFLFEESAKQICRNMASVGLDLQRHVDTGTLLFQAARPSLYGLEMHLVRMLRDIDRFTPDVVVIDPISALRGPIAEVYATVLRIVDMLKSRGITALFTGLQLEAYAQGMVDQELSSLMDIAIRLVGVEDNGEMNRTLYVTKSRGMSHSNQLREYQITDHGMVLIDPFIGPQGVLTGTARATQIALGQATLLRQRLDVERGQRDLLQRRQVMEQEIAEMRAAADLEEENVRTLVREDRARAATMEGDRAVNVERRRAAGSIDEADAPDSTPDRAPKRPRAVRRRSGRQAPAAKPECD